MAPKLLLIPLISLIFLPSLISCVTSLNFPQLLQFRVHLAHSIPNSKSKLLSLGKKRGEKLGGGFLLNVEEDGVKAANADSSITLANGFESVNRTSVLADVTLAEFGCPSYRLRCNILVESAQFERQVSLKKKMLIYNRLP